MNDEIEKYRKKGYAQIINTKAYAKFEVPKKFNWIAFILLTLAFNLFGLAGYLIYYYTRPEIREKVIWK